MFLGLLKIAALTPLFTCLFEYCYAKRCVDNIKGVCDVHDLFGWCFYNKRTGAFNCDEEKYCAKQAQIRTKVLAYGCFNRSENEVNCCCNEASMCNYQFAEDGNYVDADNENSHTQSCNFVYTVDNTEYRFNSCRDPWCINLLVQNINSEGLGREESSLKGCQSWILHRMLEVKESQKLSARLPYAKTMKSLLEHPRCSSIVDSKVPSINGTQQACIDLSFKEDGIRKKAKLCCCKGTDDCNQNISWSDETQPVDDVTEFSPVMNWCPCVNISALVVVMLLILIEQFFSY